MNQVVDANEKKKKSPKRKGEGPERERVPVIMSAN